MVVALAACSVGEFPGGGTIDAPAPKVDAGPGMADAPIDAGADPAMTFDMVIKPLATSLGCLGCHPSQHSPDLSAYDKIDPKYFTHPGSDSLLVTRGPHQSNAFFNADQKKIVNDWLDSVPAK
ncbi:MAG: hypothetical protein ABIY55_09790 [Kofleriaceae bacterium]